MLNKNEEFSFECIHLFTTRNNISYIVALIEIEHLHNWSCRRFVLKPLIYYRIYNNYITGRLKNLEIQHAI